SSTPPRGYTAIFVASGTLKPHMGLSKQSLPHMAVDLFLSKSTHQINPPSGQCFMFRRRCCDVSLWVHLATTVCSTPLSSFCLCFADRCLLGSRSGSNVSSFETSKLPP
ncbi:hypothetical protein A2U01_0056170, partial [Trifolium medium]|nr:hypothetical protein [Trifolium medium]